MTSIRPLLSLLCSAWLCAALGAPLQPGKNSVPIRGVSQDVYYYPGGAGASTRPCVLFAPGDGGWRGFALTVAFEVASWGYDFYGIDTKEYLSRFTGWATLRESDVMTDFRAVADRIRGNRSIILIGWSEGAGLMTLAAASPSKDPYAGLITMGLGDLNVLGWRFADNLTYITRRQPNEPTFSALAYMPKVAPVPLVMLHSANDEYVGQPEASRLFNAAAEPKRFNLIQGQNHRFDGAQSLFFQRLREALEWTTAVARKR